MTHFHIAKASGRLDSFRTVHSRQGPALGKGRSRPLSERGSLCHHRRMRPTATTESGADDLMYKLAFFVPESHLECVKDAVFASGAGRIGDYEACCFQIRGVGQFRPLPGAQPHIGDVGALESVEEYRVELVCEDQRIRAAIKALIDAHPYEEPAYDVWPLSDPDSLPHA
jgi:hypothetical protein